MSKRFHISDWWSEDWHISLSVSQKMLWRFMYDMADSCGVWSPSWSLASLQIGETVTEEDLDAFDGRVLILESGHIWIPQILRDQHGILRQAHRNHAAIIRDLRDHGVPAKLILSLTQAPKKKPGPKKRRRRKREKKTQKEMLQNQNNEIINSIDYASSQGKEPVEVKSGLNGAITIDYRQSIDSLCHDADQSSPSMCTGISKLTSTKIKDLSTTNYTPQNKPVSVHDWVDLWNQNAGNIFPKVQRVTPNRTKAVQARIKEDWTLEDLQEVMDIAKKSSFLCGKGKRGWKMSFDWIVGSSGRNLLKVKEGNYLGEGSGNDKAQRTFKLGENPGKFKNMQVRKVQGRDQ